MGNKSTVNILVEVYSRQYVAFMCVLIPSCIYQFNSDEFFMKSLAG